MTRIFKVTMLQWRCMPMSGIAGCFALFFNLYHGDEVVWPFCILMFAWLNQLLQSGYTKAEKNNTDILFATLGISRVEMVLGRYLVLVALPLIVGFLAFSMKALCVYAFLASGSLEYFAGMMGICIIVHILYQAALYPFFYRYGYAVVAKVLLTSVITLAVCDVTFFLRKGFSIFFKVLEALDKQVWTVPGMVIALLVCAVALWCSFHASCRIFQKRDLVQRIIEPLERLWGKVQTSRYLVSSDGSIFKMESTRRWRIHDLNQAAKLPRSRRRLRTGPELVRAVKKAIRRKELAIDRQTDRRVMKIMNAILGIMVVGSGLSLLSQMLFLSTNGSMNVVVSQSVPSASVPHLLVPEPELIAEEPSSVSGSLALFLFFLGISLAANLYVYRLKQYESRSSD